MKPERTSITAARIGHFDFYDESQAQIVERGGSPVGVRISFGSADEAKRKKLAEWLEFNPEKAFEMVKEHFDKVEQENQESE